MIRIFWDELLFAGYQDPETMLRDLYLTRKWSLERIADHLGIDKLCVANKCRELNIPIKRKGRPCHDFYHSLASVSPITF
jgi:hypothetical protein